MMSTTTTQSPVRLALDPHPRILVLETSAVIERIIHLVFQREAASVQVYRNPLTACLDIQRHRLWIPDVTFINLSYDDDLAFKAIAQLRACYPRMAIIAILNQRNPLHAYKARLAGATALVEKPLRTQQLVDLVREHSPH